MSADTRYVARAAHTHLFPGAVLAVEGLRVPARQPPPPADLDLVFADGSETAAELLAGDRPADLLLAVQAYSTAAGTAIPARLWQVRSWDAPASGSVRLRLGRLSHLQEGRNCAPTQQDAAADPRGADGQRPSGSADAPGAEPARDRRSVPVGKTGLRPDYRELDRALNAMTRVFPAVSQARIARAWTGMIDMSPDGLPFIGSRR